MARRYAISIQPRAEHDIDHIFEWLLARSPMGARNWLVALDQAFERMAESSESLGPAPEGELLGEDLKQCLFKTPRGRTYRAICLIAPNQIIVLRVRGPGQPPLQADDL